MVAFVGVFKTLFPFFPLFLGFFLGCRGRLFLLGVELGILSGWDWEGDFCPGNLGILGYLGSAERGEVKCPKIWGL